MQKILVVGAAKPLGLAIVQRLLNAGYEVIATFRHSDPARLSALKSDNLRIESLDLSDTNKTASLLAEADGAIFMPILSVCSAAAQSLPANTPALFFSSNNVSIDPDTSVYADLLTAEETIRAAAPQATIFRPTMIYGYPGDGNLGRLMKLIRRLRIAPMLGRGTALQQPVFYRDLAAVAVDALLSKADRGRTIAIAGPKPLPLSAVYREVAAASGVSALPITAPVGLVKMLIKMAAFVGLRGPLSKAQLGRIDVDKTPTGGDVRLTGTSLKDGLKSLASSLDDPRCGA